MVSRPKVPSTREPAPQSPPKLVVHPASPASRQMTGPSVTLPTTTVDKIQDGHPFDPLDKDPEGIAGELARVDRLLARTYLEGLQERWPLLTYGHDWEEFFQEQQRHVRYFHVEHLVFQPDEDPRERLKPFYAGIHGLPGKPAVFFIVHSAFDVNTRQTTIDFYLGVRVMSHDPNAIQKQFAALAQGYFPGSQLECKRNSDSEITNLHSEILSNPCEIAYVSAEPSPIRNAKDEPLQQGLESFVNTMLGNSYTAVIIAESVQEQELSNYQRELENAYTRLSPLQKITENETVSSGSTLGLTYTTNKAVGTSASTTDTEGTSTSDTEGTTDTTGTNDSHSYSIFEGNSTSHGHSSSHSYTRSRTSGVTRSIGTTKGTSETLSDGVSFSGSKNTGASHGQTIERTNKNIVEILSRLDGAIQRARKGEAYGMWKCAAYFIADSVHKARLAASAYKSLVCGDDSDAARAYVGVWDSAFGKKSYDKRPQTRQGALLASILSGAHPVLAGPKGSVYRRISPAAKVSGKELPYFLPFPVMSIPGVVVDRIAAFERSVLYTTDNKQQPKREITLGEVWHMGQIDGCEPGVPKLPKSGRAVKLNLDALTGHCLVTGSTGSGKSNTIGVLLNAFVEHQVPFLVIEPAKGEYRKDFRWVKNPKGEKDTEEPPIHIFSTHPCIGQLLRINPFRFPEQIHVLEHIDRLQAIFASCWEMTEAMPALLKKAIELAYADCGWNLVYSRHAGTPVFPTFATLIGCLRRVIQASDYDTRAKNVYTGALVTRVESLAGGLNGSIFCSDLTIPDHQLFRENCIVDLSRLGAADTKAMIMGFLVMALSEYHIDRSLRPGVGTNLPLEHVTIIEEAHNLLRNTATMPGGGSAMVTKAVETLGNAIAEMRTYGEGFLIVDQSPGALDISATRNTNTKIVMRLPEQQDCEAMARALTLNPGQTEELAKLPCGVAIVFQNAWRAPVLTKISESPERDTEKKVSPESISTSDAYWELQLRAARWIVRSYTSPGCDADGKIMAACMTWLETRARDEINEALLGATEWKDKLRIEKMYREFLERARAQALARCQPSSGVLRNHVSLPRLSRDSVPRPIFPLSTDAVREMKGRLETFFALPRTAEGTIPQTPMGKILVDLLGLQMLWRTWLRALPESRIIEVAWRTLKSSKGTSEEKQQALAILKSIMSTLAESIDALHLFDFLPEPPTDNQRTSIVLALLAYFKDEGVITAGGSEEDRKRLKKYLEH